MISCSRVSRLLLWMVFREKEPEFSEIYRYKHSRFEVLRLARYGGLLQLFV